ncbi:hypothetical protein [Tardiphaga sp. 862_B3_N1_1]|jgi:hypothetical protein|uniref:hypothetical protein n=1 Tax=Tardiphaga sp. 862_B3_N1_1 TaxID=3240763 RepID=UPI003F8A79B3
MRKIRVSVLKTISVLVCVCGGRRRLIGIKPHDRKRQEDLRSFGCETCGVIVHFVIGKDATPISSPK